MLECWLRGEKELTEGEGAEGDRGRAGPGSRRNSPAEVSSAWCVVLHLRCTLEHGLLPQFESLKQIFLSTETDIFVGN